MSDPLPVSVCILTLNEADRLERSLPPLKDFQEIVVFDSGSTDNSIALCEQVGARVEQTNWEGFGPTRKKLFQAATQPWILWLDADEVVTEDLLIELKELFRQGPADAAYSVNRIVQFQNQWIHHGDWFPDWNVRLFRSDVWEMPPLKVHESLNITGSIGTLHGLLEHHTYRDWEDQRRRSQRYAKLWAEQKLKEGKRASQSAQYTRAIWRFLRCYLLKKGFLDGELGLYIAYANAREVYEKYQNLIELKEKQ